MFPNYLLVVRPAALVSWKQPALPAEFAYHCERRTSALKRSKDQLHTAPHLFVRVKNDATDSIITKSDRQVHLELSASSFVECAAAQPRPKQVQFCLTHCAFPSVITQKRPSMITSKPANDKP
jgi:hypothetical protein